MIARLLAAILLAVGLSAPATAAVLYQDFGPDRPSPNDCSGVFGQGFDNCEDPRGSPVIAKYEAGGDWEFNSLFPGVTADMFDIDFAGEGQTGSWAYDRCAACPFITSFVVKSGAGFRWYFSLPVDALAEGTWETLTTADGKAGGLSHITFYDTLLTPNPTEVPLPMAGFLLLGALGGLGLVARRRRRS